MYKNNISFKLYTGDNKTITIKGNQSMNFILYYNLLKLSTITIVYDIVQDLTIFQFPLQLIIFIQ